MPILKPPPKEAKNETLQLRVQGGIKTKLRGYAEFIKTLLNRMSSARPLNSCFEKTQSSRLGSRNNLEASFSPKTEETRSSRRSARHESQ